MKRVSTATLLAMLLVTSGCGAAVESADDLGVPLEQSPAAAERQSDDNTVGSAVPEGPDSEPPTSEAEVDQPNDSETTREEDASRLVEASEPIEPPSDDDVVVVDPANDGGSPMPIADFVALAVEDATERFGISSDDVTVLRYEKVTWPSSALGCPEPGMGYLDVLTAGQRAILEVNGLRHHYHGGAEPIYCENPQDPLPASADPNA